jgi:hypothetical protein
MITAKHYVFCLTHPHSHIEAAHENTKDTDNFLCHGRTG